MKKVSKFISVALVLALALSLFAGLNVFADDIFIAGYEIAVATDGTDFVLDHNKNGDAAKANVTLTITDSRLGTKDGDSDASPQVDVKIAGVNFSGSVTSISEVKGTDGVASGEAKYVTYTVTFENLQYNGSSNELKLDVSYPNCPTIPLTSVTLPISNFSEIAKRPDEPEPTPEPTATPAPTAEPDLPKVMVKDFSFGGTSVEAGKEFTLDLTLFTTSGNTNLEDVMVGLNFGEAKNVSLASGSMNTYVGTLAPGATKHITYKIITDATIEPGAIGITVQLTSKNGEPNSSPISIPVTQPDRFEITGIEAPETIMLGEEGYLSVTFVNKGKSPVNNLSAEIQGTNLANPGQSQFLGNIAAGTENSVDFNVMASAEGTINGKVLLSYEDAKGEIVTLEKEFSCTVQAMPEMDPGMMDPGMMDPTMGGEVKNGMPWWGWLLIALGVAAVAAAVVLVVLKKKKAKKLAELEDDDEDI